MRAKAHTANGWLVLDKPQGMSSNQALMKIRRHFGKVKAGYAGTLDPFATGVLPIALGEATKLMDYMVDIRKAYTFTVRWGQETDTLDKEGHVTKANDARPTKEQIQAVLSQFVGKISQIPPRYSAIKIQGKRACDRMRADEEVVMKARDVFVESLALKEILDSDRATFHMVCGKGTYVRSLARDMAEALGTCGHVETLRRDFVGHFSLEQAFDYNKLLELDGAVALQQFVHPMGCVLDDIPAVRIGDQEVRKIRHGQSIPCPQLKEESLGAGVQLRDSLENLVALSIVKEGQLCPRRVFVY